MTKKYSFGNGESREKLHSEIAFGDNLIFPAQIEDLPLKKGSLAEIPKTGFQEVIKLILLSGLTLFFGTEVLGGHLLDEPVRFLFSLIQTLHLFHQNEAEIVLGVSGGSYSIDGETMFRAVAKTSIPQASIAGRASSGCRHPRSKGVMGSKANLNSS